MTFAYTALAVAVVGIATSVTLGAMSLRNQRKQARAQQEALKMQTEVQAKDRIKQIRKLASSQKASFLSSGIALTGEGTPDALFSDTYDTGIADVESMVKYGAVKGKDLYYGARAKQLQTYGQIASDVTSYASLGLQGAGGLSKGASGADFGAGGLEGMGDFGGGSFDAFGGGSFTGTLKDPNFQFNSPAGGF